MAIASLSRPCVRRTSARASEHPITSLVVSDAQAVQACAHFADTMRVLVEPACGAALATVYGQAEALAPFQSVLVIVCGGVTATTEQLRRWSENLT